MYETIPKNSSTAGLRRIAFTLVDATDLFTPEDITVTGVKVSLSFNGGTPANSTNDIVKLSSGATSRYYLELTQAESNTGLGTVTGVLQPTGCARTDLQATIGPAEAYDSPADTSGVTTLLTRVPALVPVASDYTSGRAAKLDFLDAATSSRASQTSVDTVDDLLDTEVAAIKAKTDNLPADPADASDILAATTAIAGYIDTEVAAIKLTTDHLATALELDGAVYRFTTNALEQAPSGTGASAASIRAEIDSNSTQLAAIVAGVDALPTNAELATALAAADDAVLAAIAALNNLGSAGAQAAAAAALAAYGAATGANVTAVPAAVLAAAAAAPIAADAKKMNGATIQGNGTSGNLWRG